MGGDHGHGIPQVPDFKIYQVDKIPELLKTQKALAQQGLSDPWLRNEVWRFDRKQFGTEASRVRLTMFRGLGVGVVAFLVTICVTEGAGRLMPKEEGKGSGHH